MKISTMVLLIVAGSLILAGLILCVVGLALSPGNSFFEKFLSLGKSGFVSEEHVISEEHLISEEIFGIDLQASTSEVQILKATDGVTSMM